MKNTAKVIENNPDLIAFCGLYCGACRAYLKGKCPGCEKNTKASWCKIRTCCQENHYATCSECKDYTNASQCKKFNNPVSKVISFIFRSNRQGCLDRIKEKGKENFAREMSQLGEMTLKK